MSRDAPADRSWALPVVGLLAVVVAVGVVAGGLLALGPTSSCACSPPPPAQADVDVDGNASRVTVTFTASRDAGYLLVHTAASNGSVTVADTTGDATRTDDGVRLPAVGDAVTFEPADPATNTTVEVTVVAHPPGGAEADSMVVLERTVTL